MAKKDSLYRRLNALGFICCLSFLAYLIVCLQTPASGYATPFSSIVRIALLSSTLLFFLPLLHNPAATGQRVYSFVNLTVSLSGLIAAARHLWIQSKPELISQELVTLCEQPFEKLMSQQPAITEKLSLLFNLSGNCIAEKLGPVPISFPIQALLCFLLLFLLCWKIFIYRPKPSGMFL